MSGQKCEVIVPHEKTGERLDRFLAHEFEGQSRSFLQKLIESGCVTLNGKPSKAGQKLKENDAIAVVFLPEPEEGEIVPEEIPLEVVFEDDDLIVINKAPGMSVHPGAGRISGTLVNALIARFPKLSTLSGPSRPGIVHRLDRDTSGLILVAKTDRAHSHLQRQFRDRKVHKEYTAFVWGRPKRLDSKIELPIGRGENDRKKMSLRAAKTRDAVTLYRVKETFGPVSMLEVHPLTGRTHQIRVHLSGIGHPILGDPVYGGRKWEPVKDAGVRDLLKRLNRQALHAGSIEFLHPGTGKLVRFTSPLPADMEQILHALRKMEHRET